MLMEAVCTSNLAAVVNLCGGGAENPNETGIEVDNDLSPLQWVCDNPDTPLAADMVRVMLQHGGNLDLVMDNGGRGDTCRTVLWNVHEQDQEGASALLAVIQEHDKAQGRSMWMEGMIAKIDAVWDALIRHDFASVPTLLKNVDPKGRFGNLQEGFVWPASFYITADRVPLLHAARTGDIALAMFLLEEHGARPSHVWHVHTPTGWRAECALDILASPTTVMDDDVRERLFGMCLQYGDAYATDLAVGCTCHGRRQVGELLLDVDAPAACTRALTKRGWTLHRKVERT